MEIDFSEMLLRRFCPLYYPCQAQELVVLYLFHLSRNIINGILNPLHDELIICMKSCICYEYYISQLNIWFDLIFGL